MDQLQKARVEIDGIDRAMADLFLRRMKAVEMVADYKQAHGLPVLDAVREDAVVQKNAERFPDEAIRPYYVEFLRDTMKASRHYQKKRLEGMQVAYSGIEGAFASVASAKIFPDARRVPYPDFASAYTAVENGECDVAVLPVENSTAGEVGQVIDLMFSGSLVVTGMYGLSVTHHLMAKPGARLKDIRTVISHPQALAQCDGYITAHGFKPLQEVNTALAARAVAEGDDLTVAAIAAEETAGLYGLTVLDRNINDVGINTTRFVVLSRVANLQHESGKHFILTFTVRNEAGFLAKAVNVIGDFGYNMRCLRSRPMKDLLWQYYFYVELEGDLECENGKQMLEALADYCERLKVLGSFRYPAELS